MLTSFSFTPGTVLADKWRVLQRLGAGWEGEVYQIQEIGTGIDRAAKFFFPQRNKKNQILRWYAKKLHKLRSCSIVIQYQTQEKIEIDGIVIPFLVSEFVDGILLSDFLKAQPGKRLSPFAAVHLLYALAQGIEQIHLLREYHGDLHADNIIICQYGVRLSLKLLDMYQWSAPKQANIQDDVHNLIRIFYDTIGGKKYYRRLSSELRYICCGLRRDLIATRFRTAGHLRQYLEDLDLTQEYLS